MALRKILGTFRTSPIVPLEVKAALPPLAIRLNTAIRQYAFRARKLPSTHLVKQAIHLLDTSLHLDSDMDSEDLDHNSKILRGPPTQLRRIV